MCGRYVLYGPDDAIVEEFGLAGLPPCGPRYNVAPAAPVLAIRADRQAGQRVAELMRWGLVPHWAKDPSIGARLVNARAETIATRPAFRDAFRRGRCVIPANGFYEWKTLDAGRRRKQPYYLHRADGGLVAMAGLYDRHHSSDGPVATCCIITTTANALAARAHERMPVLLDRSGVDRWLDPQARSEDLQSLLAPCPDGWLALRAVAPAVSDPRNEGATLIEPWQAGA
ncbi:MAG: SOS response-associated peptidase [Burkholderiaceae bacterium]|nr:SOS response-associated peptidase [Burkholderiaceae bacterium]